MNRALCIAIVLLSGPAGRAQEPSGFHTFTGKTGTSIEARILSISEDRSTLKMENRDGSAFESKITGLSLDDQQFVRRWMEGKSAIIRGRIQAFGILANGNEIDATAAAEFQDFVSVDAAKGGWLALRENGAVVTFTGGGENGMTEVNSIGANASWILYTKRDGSVWYRTGKHAFPESLTGAEQAVRGGNHAAVRLKDRTMVVWGEPYDEPNVPKAPPEPLSGIVDIASTQGKVAAVDKDGRVYCWDTKTREVRSAMLGDGVVDVDGSIFHFTALTRSGEVFEWARADPENAKRPNVDFGEKAIAVRAGGTTRAAQREDGTWVAWGKNAAGIVDKINGLGDVPDIAFFSEPGESTMGYVVWIER